MESRWCCGATETPAVADTPVRDPERGQRPAINSSSPELSYMNYAISQKVYAFAPCRDFSATSF